MTEDDEEVNDDHVLMSDAPLNRYIVHCLRSDVTIDEVHHLLEFAVIDEGVPDWNILTEIQKLFFKFMTC